MPTSIAGQEIYSVCQFFPNGQHEYVRRHVPVEEAIKAFKHYTASVGARMGFTVRVLITDVMDCVAMEWQYGKGIVFPPELVPQPNPDHQEDPED